MFGRLLFGYKYHHNTVHNAETKQTSLVLAIVITTTAIIAATTPTASQCIAPTFDPSLRQHQD
jgi:hypothetical protein